MLYLINKGDKMSKRTNRDTSKKLLTECGIDGGLLYNLTDDKFEIQFEYYEDSEKDSKTFSEITLLEYVATSYWESCLTLFRRVEQYDLNKIISFNRSCSYRFLPAMFCLRQYIELKLKCLYMLVNRTSFDNNHNLKELTSFIKEKGFSLNNFNVAINFVNKYEHNDAAFFRYMIDKNFKCTKKISMNMHMYNQIHDMILNMENEYNKVKDKVRYKID